MWSVQTHIHHWLTEGSKIQVFWDTLLCIGLELNGGICMEGTGAVDGGICKGDKGREPGLTEEEFLRLRSVSSSTNLLTTHKASINLEEEL